MRITRSAGYFCATIGILNLLLWAALFLTGQVTDFADRSVAYTFHLTAEFLTSVLLIAAGVSILRSGQCARRLLFFSGGMLFIAALGMMVVYIAGSYPPFVAVGAAVTAILVVFLWVNYRATADLIYLALGATLYVELTILGNLLQAGDSISAAYVAIAAAVTLPVTILIFRRPL